MTRARLRDDYSYLNPGRYGASLSDTSASSVPAVLDDLCTGGTAGNPNGIGPGSGGGLEPGGPGSVLPTVTIRERFNTGYDPDGNPMWAWANVVEDAAAIYWVERTEADDRAGLATEKAEVTLLYSISRPQIRETATVLTGDGRRWGISKIDRFPDRIVVSISRVDDDGQ